MNLDTRSITFYLAYAFSYFLSAVVIKLIGYWHSDILLAACLGVTHFLLWEKPVRLREAALLALFVAFDRDLLKINNVFPILGIGCVREMLRKDLVLQECVTFACALTLLSAGWFELGRALIVNFLLLFYFFTIGSAIVILYVKLLCALFKLSWRTFLGDNGSAVDVDAK